MAKKKPATRTAPTCWHCQDTGTCDCAFCLKETIHGREPGPCGFCAGREETAAMYAFFAAHDTPVDPLDPDLWIWHPAADGNKGWREFLPRAVFQQLRKEGKIR